MIEIDGSYGEGGGQIIRTALTLSAITRKAVRIVNIRANRPNPGLAAQHLTGARAVRSICRGTLSHCEIGSTELDFEPGEIFGGKYELDIGTAGSTILVAQTILPILAFASKPGSIKITGGTHVMKNPSYDYFEKVFIPAISLFGINVKSGLKKSGYYPQGGGEVMLETQPNKPKGNLSWDKKDNMHGLIRISGLPLHIAVREKKVFLEKGIEHVRIIEEENGIGNAALVWKGFHGSCTLGQKGKHAEDVAKDCLSSFNDELSNNADVDKHLADQLMVYAALGQGKTEYSTSHITEHAKTNKYVIDAFLEGRIRIDENTIGTG